MLVYICAELVHSKMQDVFDMVYSLLVFVNIRVILYKTYVVLICGKYNTLTLELTLLYMYHYRRKKLHFLSSILCHMGSVFSKC